MTIILYAIPVFFLLMGLEWAWDRRGQRGVYRLGDTLANLGCGIMDQTTGVLAKLLTVAAFTVIHQWGAPLRSDWAWPDTALGFVAAFVLSDFAYYWSHRWSHRVNVFWIGHVVHHQSEDYNLGVALRQSAAQKVLMMWVYWPLALVGLPPWMFATVMALNLVYQFWIHTEAIDRLGPLEWVLNTPSHHRVHHGRDPEYIDKNHGGVFIIWDRIFGTFQAEKQHPTYGITTPADTFNPVRAQLQPWGRLWRGVQSMPTLGLKLRYLFSPPGWTPNGVMPAPAITGEERKYEAAPVEGLMPALLTRWGVTLAGALGLLLLEKGLSTALLVAGIGWVLWNLWWVGATWDGRRLNSWWTGPLTDLAVLAVLAAGVAWTAVLPVALVLVAVNLQWLAARRRARAAAVS
jgi:sterol desaturase/sphingolipid hydroxylase (fatty acid hydroxylase superfamily)